LWSPWLFTWIRIAAAAAPTTHAVLRAVWKDGVNARKLLAANWAQGHTGA
jgi:hypothetical protein